MSHFRFLALILRISSGGDAPGLWRDKPTRSLLRARDVVEALNTLVSETGLPGDSAPSSGRVEAAERIIAVCSEFSACYEPECSSQEAVNEFFGSHLSYTAR